MKRELSSIPLPLIDVQMGLGNIFPNSIILVQGRSGDQTFELKIEGITDSTTKVDPKGKKPTEYTFLVSTDIGNVKLVCLHIEGDLHWSAELFQSKK